MYYNEPHFGFYNGPQQAPYLSPHVGYDGAIGYHNSPRHFGQLPYGRDFNRDLYFGRPSAFDSSHGANTEIAILGRRIDDLCHQIHSLTELLYRSEMNRGFSATPTAGFNQSVTGQNYVRNQPLQFGFQQNEIQPMRVRENDSHIFWDLCLPHMSMGDVELEVSGNRVICRTRVPVAPQSRWWTLGSVPRNLELFELADGRVEFSWLIPTSFTAKDVEATWRDGYICVCIPKTDAVAKQTVRIVKENPAQRRAASDMNS